MYHLLDHCTSSWRFRVPVVRLAVPLRHKVQSLHLNKNSVNTILGKCSLSKKTCINSPGMHWWVKRPPDGRHDGRLLWLSCRESAVREGAPGTANLAGTKHFASKIGWEPRQKSPMSKPFLSCKLAVTADRMCSHCRLTVLQFSSAAHPKVQCFSYFSSVYRPFLVSFCRTHSYMTFQMYLHLFDPPKRPCGHSKRPSPPASFSAS